MGLLYLYMSLVAAPQVTRALPETASFCLYYVKVDMPCVMIFPPKFAVVITDKHVNKKIPLSVNCGR